MSAGYAKRTDANQKAVVEELKKYLPEATVFVASGTGAGFTDIVVGWKGHNFLMELKDPDKPASARKLTKAQSELHQDWQGQISVVHSATEIVSEMLRFINKIYTK